MVSEIQLLTTVLHQQGVYAALEYLNSRTPHRYTGLFRFDGDTLRNEVLFDRNQPGIEQGIDVPMALTHWLLTERSQTFPAVVAAEADARAQPAETPIISYCGVLIRDAQGQAYGLLCHYDMQRCQERTTDAPLLAAAATLFYQYLYQLTANGA